MKDERIICDDKNPPCINKEIKKLINEKNSNYRSYCSFNRNAFLFEKFGEDKQCLKSYRPISLLPIFSKFFEHLIYNKPFTFFTDNKLISLNQSKLRPGDSCVDQLLAIAHEIYKSFDDSLEVRGVLLDISKAFDKVLHDGLFLKLSLNGISGNVLEFLCCHKQRVVLNGLHSS